MPKLGRKKWGSDLTVIIPAAGTNRRLKSNYHKSLTEITPGETVLNRQIRLVRNLYPKAEIIVVVGFQSEEVMKSLPKRTKVVENEMYQETGTLRSISLGLKVSSNDNVLVIYGDLVFNPITLSGITSDGSKIIVDSKHQFNVDEIGVTGINGKAIWFSYGLDKKWGQILFMNGMELEYFKQISYEKESRKLNTYEVLNKIIEKGGNFETLEPKYMSIVEIDYLKDIERSRKVR